MEIRIFITLCLCSGAMYLDMLWHCVSLKSIPEIFRSTICDIEKAVDYIFSPCDIVVIKKLINDWSKKHKDHHGFTSNMGNALAVDGFVIEIKKSNSSDLDGQQVGYSRNLKGFSGLISQVARDSNAKVQFIQTDWPGARNRLSCFRERQLY
jgi:hypothetical protein